MDAAAETCAEDSTGRNYPLGATVCSEGVNFSIYSRTASAVDLLLFDREDDIQPSRVIPINPLNRTYHIGHTFVPGLLEEQLYGYRVSGRYDPANGLWFDSGKVLLDPYGRCVAVPQGYSRAAAKIPGDTASPATKSVVVDSAAYDWEGDTPLRHPSARTIIYEMHVRGFLNSSSHRGMVVGGRDGSIPISTRQTISCHGWMLPLFSDRATLSLHGLLLFCTTRRLNRT